MMNSVAPFWDGNETWLVLGGAGMMVAFPLAYSIILPALYLPVIVMLLALVFRGVAFEFRWIGVTSKRIGPSPLSPVRRSRPSARALILGGLDPGHQGEQRRVCRRCLRLGDAVSPSYAGSGLSRAMRLLGATWLVMKTEGSVARRARTQAKLLLLVVLGFMAIVSIWTPLAFERIAVRWFSLPNILFFWWVPAATALVAFAAWRWLDSEHDVTAVPRDHRAVSAGLSWSSDLELSPISFRRP